MKLRLVTVTGSRTNTLYHMLKHYAHLVHEMYVVVYEWEGFSTYDAVLEITKQFSNATIVRRETKEKYNWEYVTELYNEAKLIHPNDWWIVCDDDEFHSYSKPLYEIIMNCEINGWKMVRGGFIDRVSEDGKLIPIHPTNNIFEQFPKAGFFRYPMSGANPNKVCLMLGSVELTAGQHYANLDGHTTWRWQGWNHPLIAPIDEYSVHVHHFKWDEGCVDRIKDVANINKDYAYSSEYRKMYQSLRSNNFELDTTMYQFEYCPTANFENYKNWNKLLNKIISI
jgi:hypothetical protein